jgi:hypothetical protein
MAITTTFVEVRGASAAAGAAAHHPLPAVSGTL